jgi:hypothetical protein
MLYYKLQQPIVKVNCHDAEVKKQGKNNPLHPRQRGTTANDDLERL